MANTKPQSAQTRRNIEKARAHWREKQETKSRIAERNRSFREKRGDKGQLARLDTLGLTAAKERAKLQKRLEESND